MIVNTMAMMVLRDAILDDITSVNSMMWYINLLITLFHRCDAVARSLIRSFSVFQYDKIHKNESRTTMIAMSLVAIMFMKKATTYYGIPTTRNGGCVNIAMKNDIGFNSCGNDSNGERENLSQRSRVPLRWHACVCHTQSLYVRSLDGKVGNVMPLLVKWKIALREV